MTPDPKERILDACLEEILGQAQPPELTDQILARLAQGPAAPPLPMSHEGQGSERSAIEAPPLPAESSLVQPKSQPVQIRTRRRRANSTSARWSIVMAATSAAVLIGAFVVWQRLQVNSVGGPGHVEALVKDDGPATDPNANDPPENVRPGPQDVVDDGRDPEIQLAPFDEPLFPTGDLFSTSSPDLDPPEQPIAPRSASQQWSDEQIVQGTNRILAQAWREASVTAAPATDEQWCRRLYLQMLGRIPTVAELQAFAQDDQPNRRDRLVRQLQDGDNYAEEYAAHWASFWGTVLVGRRGGMDEDASSSREHLEEYLRESIKQDKPYDEMVRELISAAGSSRPGASDYNPATNFLLASMDDGGDKQALLATSRTFQVFHGQQVRCIQCHPHPNNGWSQQEFWSLNAFFRQMKVKRGNLGPALVDVDFKGEGPGGIAEAESFYEQLNGETVAALPKYPSGSPVSASGRVEDVNRRKLLADFVAADPKLSRATVNRLWAHFHGHGFTRPVDDMGPHNPVSHPELLDLLADQFAGSGYQLDRLVRWIASSDSFSRTSQVSQTASVDSPESGRPLFSRYYTRQLQPEAVYDSLKMVADMGPRDTSLEGRSQWLGQFIQPMGTDEGQELSTYEGDVRQSLIIMNGPLMRKATNSENSDGLLHRVVKSKMSLDKKIEHLFMASVARKPTRRELTAIRQLQAKQPDASTTLESIWWALLNSNEFILDH